MFRKTTARLALLCLLLATSAWSVEKGKKNPDNLVARALLPVLASHPLRLLASDFSLADVELDPTDPTTLETLQTGTLASVSLPANPSRTTLLICASGPHIYGQIPSSAPFRFGGSYRIAFTSSVLPGPFSFGFGFNTQREFAPSTQKIWRTFDPNGCGAFDETVLGVFLANDFDLTPEQGQLLARDLLASEITIEESARITVQSVSFFDIGNAALQIFGD